MRRILSAVLYTALMLGANSAMADLASLRDGDMKKLVVHSAAKPAGTSAFTSLDGDQQTLADYKGKVILLNFWATWCPPCLKEMPTLSALQANLGGDDFEVLTIATGPNNPVKMRAFFDEIGVDNLPLLQDQRKGLAHEMAVLGLPITVILNREGQEIARLRGDADWNSDSAQTILRAAIAED